MSLPRADNGMDPYTVLGISARTVRGKSDLYKLRSRCKTMIDNYMVKRQGGNARRVKWAFDQIKVKVSQESKERAAAAAAGAAAGAAAPEAGPVPEAPAPDEPPVDRLDAIRNKAAARRERAAAGQEDPDTVKRRDSIREKLAVKRMLKQVPALKEEECKQRVVQLLEAPPPEAGPAPERVSLACPASGSRLQTPGRGKDCQHLQCFDVEHHLSSKSSRCPVCGIELESTSAIFVDGYVTKILTAAGEKVKEVTFDRNGVWAAARDRPAKATAAKAGAKSSKAAARPATERDVAAGAAAVPAAAPVAAAGAPADAAPREKRPREAAAAPAPTPQAEERKPEEMKPEERKPEERKPEAEKRPAEAAPQAAGAEEAAPAPAPAPEVPRMAPPKRRKPPPPTPEQLKEQAEREEKRKRAKMYHTLRAEELVDPMNEVNYIAVELPTKNMGVVFRPNPSFFGGIFVEALDAEGVAARHAGLKVGDQLVGIGDKLVKGRDIDACIDLVVPDGRGLAKLTVFRGTASGLYGKGGAGGASDEWLGELMAKVADGRLEVTPPAPEPEPDLLPEPESEGEEQEEAAQPAEKRRKNHRLSISDSESEGSDGEADDFSLDISEDSEAEASQPESRPTLPERLASRVTGAGLEEDLESFAEALSQLPPDGAFEHLPVEPRLLARLVVKACTAKNQEAWAGLDEEAQASWRKAVRRRLAKAAGQRAEKLEAARRRRQQEQQCSELAAVAAAAASRQGGGKEDRAAAELPLLQVQPDKVIKFDYNRTAQVTLRNPSQGHTAFRIRTSNPRSISVQPCAGTLQPSEQVTLKVCSTERPLGHSDLKFLVQAVPAPDAGAMSKEQWVELGTSAIKEWSLVGRL